MRKLIFFSLIIIALCSSCAMGPKYNTAKIEDGKSMVYIYRVSKFCLSTRSPSLYFDKTKVMSFFLNNGYTLIPVNPGSHEIMVDGFFDIPKLKVKEILKDTKPGSNYYVKYEIFCHGIIKTSFTSSLHQVEEEKALKDISENRYIEPNTTTSQVK